MTVRAGSASSDSAWEAGSRSCWWRTTGSPSLARIAAVSPRASIRFSTARARSLAATAPRTRRYGGVAAELERALTAADVPHDVKEYPDAGHSFLNDHDPRELNALVVLLALAVEQPVPRTVSGRRPAPHPRLLRRTPPRTDTVTMSRDSRARRRRASSRMVNPGVAVMGWAFGNTPHRLTDVGATARLLVVRAPDARAPCRVVRATGRTAHDPDLLAGDR